MYLRVCSTKPYPFDGSTQQDLIVAPFHPATEFAEQNMHVPVIVSFDATTTVRACAQALCEWHRRFATAERPGPIPDTILVTDLSGAQWLADPFTLLAHAPIHSGSCLTPVSHDVHLPQFVRATPPAAELLVFTRNGSPQIFTLVTGENTIGRDHENRVIITDRSVSRVHATLHVAASTFTVQDHNSHNGTQVHSQKARSSHTYPFGSHGAAVRITFGGVAAEIRAYTAPEPAQTPTKMTLSSPVNNTMSPHRFENPVTAEELCVNLPPPPSPAPPHKFPVLTVLAPVFIGTILFLVTHSALSLIGIAFSPIIALGSWLEHRWSRRKQSRIDTATYTQALERVTQRVETLHTRVRAVLAQQYPPLNSRTPRSCIAPAPRRSHHTWIRCGIAHAPSGITFTATSNEQHDLAENDRSQQIRQQSQWVDHAVIAHDIAGTFVLVQGNRNDHLGVMRATLLHACLSTPPNTALVQVFIPSAGDGASEEAEWDWAAWLPYSLGPAAPQRVLSTHPSEPETIEMFCALAQSVCASPADEGTGHSVYLVLVDAPEYLLHRAGAFLASPQGKCCTLISNLALPDAINAPRTISYDIARTMLTIVTHRDNAGHAPENSRETMAFSEFDSCTQAEALNITKTLLQHATQSAPETQKVGELALPDSLPITQLAPLSEIRSVSHQEIAWQQSHSISTQWSIQRPDFLFALNASIGAAAHGQLHLDLRKEGPHALVIGTTGSGKSIFLQTWILSLAAAHGPDRLNFFLLDFKGGATFKPCAELPHIVGFVTDLTPHLAERARIALQAEVLRREALLFEKTAADIATLEALSLRDAPPNLVIIIDECAVLFREHPPFRETLQDISQRGRSLGIHLILSSQRSVGVIPDAVRSNITIRVAMRLADPAESIDVLGTNDAAHISQTHPGRGYIRLGSDPPKAFQGGCAVGFSPNHNSRSVTIQPLMPRHLGTAKFSTTLHAPRPAQHEPPSSEPRQRVETQIIQRMHCATRSQKIALPRTLWCRPLPQKITRQSACQDHQISHSEVTIGIRDEPGQQRQTPETINPLVLGNVLVWGTTASGKTTTAVTLTTEVLRCAPATWVYILQAVPTHTNPKQQQIDPSDHPPQLPQHPLNHIGQHIDIADKNHLRRFVNTLSGLMQCPSQNAYRPHILVVIDSLETLNETIAGVGSVSDAGLEFTALFRHAARQNCSIIATAQSVTAVPRAWVGLFSRQILHRLPPDNDSQYFQGRNVPKRIFDLRPGRALVRDEMGSQWHELQIFQPEQSTQPETEPQVWPPAPTVPRLPPRFTREAWERQDPGAAWFALDTATFEACAAPPNGLCVVTGAARSGRSSALATLREAAIDRLRIQGHEYVSLRVHADPCDQPAPNVAWSLSTAHWSEGLAYLADLPKSTHRIIVCDFHTIAHANETEQPNHAHLSGVKSPSLLSRCSTVNTLIICEVPHRVAAQKWELLSELRDANWILALKPDSSDLPSVLTAAVPRCQREDFPSGSGFIVQPGNITAVQVALPIDTDYGGPPPIAIR